jgi:hypothetical protein
MGEIVKGRFSLPELTSEQALKVVEVWRDSATIRAQFPDRAAFGDHVQAALAGLLLEMPGADQAERELHKWLLRNRRRKARAKPIAGGMSIVKSRT